LLGIQQEKQRTSNVTLRHLRTTCVALEEQNVLHIMSLCL